MRGAISLAVKIVPLSDWKLQVGLWRNDGFDTASFEIGSVHASVVSLECSELPFRW